MACLTPEDLEYMTRKLIEEYELWGLKLNIKKETEYVAVGDTSRDLQLEDGKGTISHESEYVYLGVRLTEFLGRTKFGILL